MPGKVAIVSLGCAKNQVDTENMAGVLSEAGYILTGNPEEAGLILINTCGFINAAKEESIDTILEMAQIKQSNPRAKLVVAGCLAQRYLEDLAETLPEIDGFLGTGKTAHIARIIERVLNGERVLGLHEANAQQQVNLPRISLNPSATAYVKIAEGCDNRCTYCAIPRIRGPYTSRPLEAIVEEAEMLVHQGIKEVILIAQDTTGYGLDLYGEYRLSALLQRIVQLPGLEWIRLLYSYPARIDDALIEVIAGEPKICNYLDIPLQHAHQRVLRSMGRRGGPRQIAELIAKLRKTIPDLTIRTTMMVGFPEETEEEFARLLDFMEETRFDWAGVFTYSREEDTPAAAMEVQVDEEVKEERYHRLMMLQREITRERNSAWVGRVVPVLVEGVSEEKSDLYYGRSERSAPEVDGLVYFKAPMAIIGEFVPVRITCAEDYDLIGEMEA
ncbi:MAG: 30S ribosomal protein S12 methylthiotransferase RimO [Bacillota bacterium]